MSAQGRTWRQSPKEMSALWMWNRSAATDEAAVRIRKCPAVLTICESITFSQPFFARRPPPETGHTENQAHFLATLPEPVLCVGIDPALFSLQFKNPSAAHPVPHPAFIRCEPHFRIGQVVIHIVQGVHVLLLLIPYGSQELLLTRIPCVFSQILVEIETLPLDLQRSPSWLQRCPRFP